MFAIATNILSVHSVFVCIDLCIGFISLRLYYWCHKRGSQLWHSHVIGALYPFHLSFLSLFKMETAMQCTTKERTPINNCWSIFIGPSVLPNFYRLYWVIAYWVREKKAYPDPFIALSHSFECSPIPKGETKAAIARVFMYGLTGRCSDKMFSVLRKYCSSVMVPLSTNFLWV